MRFSVIVPVYNVERYIEECLESIVNQDYPANDFEVIIIDDCSPDSSIQIAGKFRQKYHNIRILSHSKNKHLGGARNTGIRQAKGEYLFFLDSDDKWEDSHILKTFNFLINKQKHNVDYIKSSTYNSLGTSGAALKSFSLISGNEYVASSKYASNVWTGCYNRTFLQRNNLYFRENIAFEDSDWSLIVAHKADTVLLIEYPFYGYRLNPESITNKPSIKTFKDNITSALEVYSYIQQHEKDQRFVSAAYPHLLKTLLSYPLISRNYFLKQSLDAIKPLRKSGILCDKKITAGRSTRLVLKTLQSCPTIMLLPIRCISILRLFGRRLYGKVSRH